tara:strand:+ start:54 stop:389 length:336 start_codon:yes stop_codon:yes gene_type:complete
MSLGYIIAKNDKSIKNKIKNIEKYEKKIENIYINLKQKKNNNKQYTKDNYIKFEILTFYLNDILNNYNEKYYKLLDLLEYINKNKKGDIDYILLEINHLKNKIKNLEKILN